LGFFAAAAAAAAVEEERLETAAAVGVAVVAAGLEVEYVEPGNTVVAVAVEEEAQHHQTAPVGIAEEASAVDPVVLRTVQVGIAEVEEDHQTERCVHCGRCVHYAYGYVDRGQGLVVVVVEAFAGAEIAAVHQAQIDRLEVPQQTS